MNFQLSSDSTKSLKKSLCSKAKKCFQLYFYFKMDLTRLPNDKKLELCKWYFKVGCLLLPFVWGVNAIWFFKEAFMKPPYEEQKQIKKYVLMSAAGAIAWMAVFAVWITIFQLQRVSWGSTGDALSFIVPLGRA